MKIKQKNAHILFVVPKLTGGGAERVVAVLASGMAEQGYRVSMLLNKRVANEYPLSEKVHVFVMNERHKIRSNAVYKLSRMYERYKIMKKINPNVIVPFLLYPQEQSFLVNLFMHKKFVSTIRINPQYCDIQGHRWIRDAIIAVSTACFVQNSEQRAYFPSFVQKKTFIVPNPVSQEFLSDTPHRCDVPRTIMTAGRLTEQKNQKMLIRAVASLREKYPDIRLIIYGEGEERVNLASLIDELNAQDTVMLAGRCNYMPQAYRDADIFALVSDYEGMPNALMEAMAGGLPCISTDCPTGPKDLILDGNNGLMIPVGDQAALEAALDKLLSNAEQRNRMAEEAWKMMREQYTAERIVDLFVESIDRYCINGRK